MCNFFSFVMDKQDNIYYLDKEQRKECVGTYNNPDSHSFICEFYHLNEDNVNTYEFIKELKVDSEVFETTQYQKDKINYFIKNINLKDLVWDSHDAYLYCIYVDDDKEIRDKITNSYDAYMYCRYVKDRKEVRDKITNSNDAYLYCVYIKDRKEIRNKITNSNDAYLYCRDIKDRKEIK